MVIFVGYYYYCIIPPTKVAHACPTEIFKCEYVPRKTNDKKIYDDDDDDRERKKREKKANVSSNRNYAILRSADIFLRWEILNVTNECVAFNRSCRSKKKTNDERNADERGIWCGSVPWHLVSAPHTHQPIHKHQRYISWLWLDLSYSHSHAWRWLGFIQYTLTITPHSLPYTRVYSTQSTKPTQYTHSNTANNHAWILYWNRKPRFAKPCPQTQRYRQCGWSFRLYFIHRMKFCYECDSSRSHQALCTFRSTNFWEQFLFYSLEMIN